MPKIIELTVEIVVQKVSCPGVWLCQDGRVRLMIYALGTAYQTCLLPPLFPLTFKDVFYFKKRYQKTCAINNICCLLRDETLYCELVQTSQDCLSEQTIVLAQYLGSLNDVLFPPSTCNNDGVDLLTRRTSDFPGILSPKIEIATKVRIDEKWHQNCPTEDPKCCNCVRPDDDRPVQKPSCHSARYHRHKCNLDKPTSQDPRPRSRSRSASRVRRNNLTQPIPKSVACNYNVPSSRKQSRRTCSPPRCNDYCVYNVSTNGNREPSSFEGDNLSDDYLRYSNVDSDQQDFPSGTDDHSRRVVLESRYVSTDKYGCDNKKYSPYSDSYHKPYNTLPCVCEICRKYHQLFHKNDGDMHSDAKSVFL